ncbi:PEP-CTERM sorting domain-containing protein [Alteromonas oceanisediminis]|uniref:PEP-CTERM sorting domain-containing protein n=1 Tax=Alteromonas oceanisediminis TaxID=2836180 RepID=UPI001BDA4A99|nr:PEP-CTERM sorting domain-containing protein [Alteromonas oceanisediminis]MBT0585476.1 PEP-CTERM sorting domain-containing protein [Alteromonas oceanisediminis]
MKSLKQLLINAAAATGLLLATTFSANATLITQDIIAGGFNIATVEIDVPDEFLGTGLIDTAFDGVPTLVSLNFFGVFPALEIFDFQAVINTDDLFAGIEFLAIDAIDSDGSNPWTYQIIIDIFDPSFNFVDIFDANNDPVFFSADVQLSQAQVNTPATLGLFVLAIAGVFAARMRKS